MRQYKITGHQETPTGLRYMSSLINGLRAVGIDAVGNDVYRCMLKKTTLAYKEYDIETSDEMKTFK